MDAVAKESGRGRGRMPSEDLQPAPVAGAGVADEDLHR